MQRFRLIQISNGVGSGNIGDELMAQEFWKLLPGNVELDVPVYPEAGRFRGDYPALHRYLPLSTPAAELPGLLVGDTPVAEFEGLGYPLLTVGPAISTITRRGWPVDAIAVGVDRLHTPEGRLLFTKHYSGIRSWTVRSEACREALLDLGVPRERIRVAADLAWRFTPGAERDAWAAAIWEGLGIEAGRPLLVVNTVHHVDPAEVAPKRALAEALDRLAREGGYQIAFLHNESRTGPGFDAAAAAGVRARMQTPSVEVPAAYYTPEEMVSLLRPATTVLTQRYHMAIQAILAGTIPVCLSRGQKLSELAREFDLPAAGLEAEAIVERVQEASARRPERLQALAEKREEHRARAGEALSFFREYYFQEGHFQGNYGAGVAARPVPGDRRQVVVVHLGGLGDLVLASALVEALRRQDEQASIRLLCRAPFAKLAELFPVAPDEVVPVRLDPNAYSQPDEALRGALRELETQLGGLRPDVLVSAELEPTWLSWYLASRWRAPVNLACTRLEAPRGLLPILLHEGGMTPVAFAGPAWHAEMIEGDRYAQLAAAAGAEAGAAPRWTLIAEQERETAAFLRANGIDGEYAVCFPLGAASTLVKRWPAESFALALEAATGGFGLPVLLTGEAHERAALEAHADMLRRRGAAVTVFAGTADEIGLLAGLLGRAKFFLGNDTGPAHIAQAYGTPGAVVFGGGTWPHYRPWGPGTIGVVHPLACFGCRWDCAFGQPICIGGITVETVVRALQQALANPGGAADVMATATASPELQTITGAAAQHYRAVQEDRLARHRALVETEYAKSVAEGRNAALAEQLIQVQANNRVTLHNFEAHMAHVDSRMAAGVVAAGSAVQSATEWRTAAEERLVQLEELSRTHTLVAAEARNRAHALDELDRLFREAEARRAQAQEAAELRLALIESISRELTDEQNENAARLAALAEADGMLRRRDAELQELRAGYEARVREQQSEVEELRAGHAARLVAIEEADRMLRQRDAELLEFRAGYDARLQEQQAEVEALRAGHAARLVAIEEANVLLAKQQGEIAELRDGYAARLVAIEEANLLLVKQQGEIAELREGYAARLVAIEEANVMLREQQGALAGLRSQVGALEGEKAQLAVRVQELDGAATERLAALEHANQLLGAAHAANAEQGERLRVFEQAAVERLAALEATTASLRTEMARRAQLAADLEAVAAAQAEASRRQSEEREGWQGTLAALRAELQQERAARLGVEEQLITWRANLELVTAERDRYRRSTEELVLSEQALRRQILAAETETLLQSIFRRATGKSH
jgi:ADP-heptose:LPS heptosyltransferase